MIKRFFRKIHLWLSVPFGLLVSLICFSGAMLVFEDEAARLLNRRLFYVDEVKDRTLPLDELAARVAASLPEGTTVTGMTVFADKSRTVRANLSKPRRARAFIDPYTGEVKGVYERPAFFATMFKMHRWMLDSMRPEKGIWWGKMIVGVSTLLFIVALVSGIVIWWPRTRKGLSGSLKLVADKGWKRFWHSLHIAGGMYAVVFLLAMGLTGLTWSFGWYRNAFYRLFGAEVVQASPQQAAESKKGTASGKGRRGGSDMRNWQQVYEKLAAANASFSEITVSGGTATVSSGTFGNQRASDRYEFDPATGEITGVSLYKDTPRSGKIRGWIYSVHVGSWGGYPTRVLYFAAALLGAALPLTGYYLWIARLLRKGRRRAALP